MANNIYTDLFEARSASGRAVGVRHWNKNDHMFLASSAEVTLNRIPRGDILLLIAGNNFLSQMIPKPTKKNPELPEYTLGFDTSASEIMIVEPKLEPVEFEAEEHKLTLVYDMARFLIESEGDIEFRLR